MNRGIWMGVAIWLVLLGVTGGAEKEQAVTSYLKKGDLAGAQEALTATLKKTPDDSEARFSLGIVQFLGGVERLSQSLYKHGLQPGGPSVPFLRLDVPVNRDPEPIDYAKFRKIFERFADDLEAVDETLQKVDDPELKVRIPVGLIKLDLDGDGKASDEETFWRLFVSVAGPQLTAPQPTPPPADAQPAPPPAPAPPANAKKEKEDKEEKEDEPAEAAAPQPRELNDEEKAFEVAFDQADVHWLRGYTHVLRGLLEANLAYDGEDFFKHTGHVFFAGAKPPYKFLKSGQKDDDADETTEMASRIADVIAAIHLMKLKPTEPDRLRAAHEHFLAMIEQSRECVRLAGKEKDNDCEWIPNPKQQSVVPIKVTEDQFAAWNDLLDEWEALLQGKKLLPHWNIPGDGGINLKKVFHEPRDFDLVMWIHGAGLAPYLEKGERTSPEKWMEINRTFRGNLFFVALWFN